MMEWRYVQKGKEENDKRNDNIRLVTSFSRHSSQVRVGENRDFEQHFLVGP